MNFRKKIELGIVPSASDLTCEGLFAEYSFKTDAGDGEPAASSAKVAAGDKAETELFAPTYTDFQSRHPITMEDELFLSVGLTSNLKASQFPRKPLNLVITLEYVTAHTPANAGVTPCLRRRVWCVCACVRVRVRVQHIRLDGLCLRYRLHWQAQDRDRQGGNPHAP